MKRTSLLNALIWAAVILIVSYILRDSEAYKSFFPVLIITALLQMGLFQDPDKKNLGGPGCKKWIKQAEKNK